LATDAYESIPSSQGDDLHFAFESFFACDTGK
jgi:hypothetical protein